MIKQFYNIVERQDVLDKLNFAINNFNTVGYPFTTYFGINYLDKNIVGVKFYIVFFAKVELSLLGEFFPDLSELKRLYNDYRPTREYNLSNLGVTIAIKVNNKGDLSYSYYQQHGKNQLSKPIGLPSVSITDVVRGDLRSIEFDADRTYEKSYYMFEDKRSIATCLKEFSLKVDPHELRSVEYSEFDGKQKLVLIFEDHQDKDVFEKATGGNYFFELKSLMEETYGFHSDYPGLYKQSGVQKSYFFKKNQKDNFFQSPNTIGTVLRAISDK